MIEYDSKIIQYSIQSLTIQGLTKQNYNYIADLDIKLMKNERTLYCIYIYKIINNIKIKKVSYFFNIIHSMHYDLIFIIPTNTHTICKICYTLSLHINSAARFGECWSSARRQWLAWIHTSIHALYISEEISTLCLDKFLWVFFSLMMANPRFYMYASLHVNMNGNIFYILNELLLVLTADDSTASHAVPIPVSVIRNGSIT
jgi:hypothetical protein